MFIDTVTISSVSGSLLSHVEAIKVDSLDDSASRNFTVLISEGDVNVLLCWTLLQKLDLCTKSECFCVKKKV
jgi:hypothetical protein